MAVSKSELSIGVGEYEVGSAYHDRATILLSQANWTGLLQRCTELRKVSCQLSEQYSIGHDNMVRRIEFDDGVSWVARLRLPKMEDNDKLADRDAMFMEVSSMRFLKIRTSILVPELFDFSLDVDNAIGAPYMLMEYVDAATAERQQAVLDCERDTFGTAEQDCRFRAQMAEIQAELVSHRFDRIGALYSSSNGESEVGPELQTGKGPWKTAVDYYTDLAEHAKSTCLDNSESDARDRPSFALPDHFKELMRDISQHGDGKGPFCLANRDFGPHNLLVNGQFEIIAVIDLDSLIAGPVEVAAQLPKLCGYDVSPPGIVETKPRAIELCEKARTRANQYKRRLSEAEARIKTKGRQTAGLAGMMFGDQAEVYRDMTCYMSYQAWVNDEWMEAYAHIRGRTQASKT